MADINYCCPTCEKNIAASEYADAARLKCPGCGATGLFPPGADDPQAETADRRSPLQLRPRKRPPAPSESEPEREPDGEPSQAEIMKDAFGPHRKRVDTDRYRGGTAQVLGAWAVFLILGGTTYVLRYQNIGAPADMLAAIRQYAWVPIALMWLISVGFAIKDSIFVGILCLLVPGYFLFYLLSTDHFFLRAITFGLLVGLGQDTFVTIQEKWDVFYHATSEWIESGGGD